MNTEVPEVPYIIRPRQIHRFAVGLFGALLLIGAAPALAQASCPLPSTLQAFQKFGDTASYTLVEGGLFESGAPNWSLNRAQIINESPEEETQRYEQVGYRYDGYYNYGYHPGLGHSLAIDDNGEAVSPPFCVNAEFPSFRFLARQRYGYYGRLSVSLRWSDSNGTHETADAEISPSSKWTLTPVLLLASKLPAGTTPNVRLVFQPTGGEWAIDDVYIDPYRR
jgi:hypothetical protein